MKYAVDLVEVYNTQMIYYCLCFFVVNQIIYKWQVTYWAHSSTVCHFMSFLGIY